MHEQRKAVLDAPVGRWRAPASGQPLDRATRQWMESRFDHDFSRVRVHADPAAAQAADALGARAFTQNEHIAFSAGAFAPHTHAGRHLLAHELAHVVGAREPLADSAASDVMLGRVPAFAHDPAPHAIQMKEKSLQERAREVEDKLQNAIDMQPEVRRTMRKEHAAPMRERAKERKEGALPELTGIGRIQSLDHFASSVRALQPEWGLLAPQQRVEKIGAAASVELENAEIPGFLDVKKKNLVVTEAGFNAANWWFLIDKGLVEKTVLEDEAAAKLVNAAMHESRHAEQHFLAARHAAGEGKGPKTIAKENGIPIAIARRAYEKKFDASTDPATADLGASMFKAHVSGYDQKEKTIKAMKKSGGAVIRKRLAAERALNRLKKGATEKRITQGNAAYEALVDEIHGSRESYKRYLDLPSEVDASEVGESAAEAFRENT